MGSFRERTKGIVGGLAFWMILAGSASCQEVKQVPTLAARTPAALTSAASTPAASTADASVRPAQANIPAPLAVNSIVESSEPGEVVTTSQCPPGAPCHRCRQNGSPENWPCPCHGATSCDACYPDLTKSLCPKKCDFFLEPPRLDWYGTMEGAAIRRNPTEAVDFASLGPGVPVDVILSTRQFDYDLGASGHFMIGRTLGECFQIEGEYLGVVQEQDSAAVRDTSPNELGGLGNLFSPFGGFGVNPVVGLDYNNFAEIRYVSALHSAEVNVRRKIPLAPSRLAVSALVGIRYIGLPEDFEYLTISALPTPGGAVNAVHVTTNNEMIGPQIGARTEWYLENRWWLNFEIKGAVLNNRAKQTTVYTNIVDGVGHEYTFSDRESHTAFAGDLSLKFVYRWTPNISTHLGYQAMFLQDLALAPNNFNRNVNILTQGPAELNHDSASIYHGPFAGIDFGW
ncbi:MAG: BBP7 family outer membrane beta-barrel protein [Pirellulales bacterium]